MSPADEASRLQSLQRLARHRESIALEALGTAREAVAVAQQGLDTQRRIIDELSGLLRELAEWRASTEAPDTDDLLRTSDRRRWLTADLEKEQYYLGVAQSDWQDAWRQMNIARRAWLALRIRIDALEARLVTLAKNAANRAEQVDSLLMDDRFNREFVCHG